MNNRQFIDPDLKLEIASASLSEDFQIGGRISQEAQSDHVPFTYNVYAINPAKNIALFAFSEEIFYDLRSDLVRKAMNALPSHIKQADKPFISVETYLKQFAESVFANPLTPLAKADLPSINSLNRQDSYQKMMNFYNTYFNYETNAGMKTLANNVAYDGYLYKYEGIREDVECTVLAGMDFKGIEYYSPDTAFLENMNFFGSSNSSTNKKHSDVFGEGYPCNIIEWGSDARYILIVTKQNEKEGIAAFIDFVSTYKPNPELERQYQQIKYQNLQNSYNQTLQYQGMARQSQLNLQFQQQKLANMLNQNANSISQGIMDSWDKKMAADSRISENYSQAIRGVNTYQTTDGRNVEVSVAADHVYQDKYGDIHGVSGNSLDNDLLNKLNWEEINKK